MEKLNLICRNCLCLDADCKGTKCQTWTGCVYKVTAQQALKKKLVELSSLEAAADKAEAEMLAAPTNTEKEKAFDEAYKAEYATFSEVAEIIVKATKGRVDEQAAREMVQTNRNKILNFIA